MPAHPRTPGSLVRDLRVLGAVTGDTLMVHASLRHIGPVVGSALLTYAEPVDARAHRGGGPRGLRRSLDGGAPGGR